MLARRGQELVLDAARCAVGPERVPALCGLQPQRLGRGDAVDRLDLEVDAGVLCLRRLALAEDRLDLGGSSRGLGGQALGVDTQIAHHLHAGGVDLADVHLEIGLTLRALGLGGRGQLDE